MLKDLNDAVGYIENHYTIAKTASEWFPPSNFEQIDLPNFSFTIMDAEKEGFAYSEIWIPVQEK